MHYTQCTMVRQLEGSATSRYVAWIPSSFAKLNKTLALKFGDVFVEGWKVVNVGVAKEAEEVERKSRDYKNSFSSIEPRKG